MVLYTFELHYMPETYIVVVVFYCTTFIWLLQLLVTYSQIEHENIYDQLIIYEAIFLNKVHNSVWASPGPA